MQELHSHTQASFDDQGRSTKRLLEPGARRNPGKSHGSSADDGFTKEKIASDDAK